MIPYEYYVMKFANQWASSEHSLHFDLSQKNISSEAVVKALQYFQVARNFNDLKVEKNRDFIVENLLIYSKHLTNNNFHDKVQNLAEKFREKFGSLNLSAASKLLWLRKRYPVIIYDNRAKRALENFEDTKIACYFDYSEAWKRNYALHKPESVTSKLATRFSA